MGMYSFVNDYSEGGHERILEALCRTNREQTPGYGLDPHCQEARALILSRLDSPDSAVHFLVGGTQVNTVLLAAALRPHQGAVCPASGHINVHESGAIEATGHKVLPIPTDNGKITAEQVAALAKAHYDDVSFEHMVQPGLVYISDTTEVGTLYTKGELAALRQVCDRYHLYLYVDGARLGCALTAEGNDLTLRDLARLAHAFTIGGTKMGALFGEALVISSPSLNRDFRYIIKQKGGMLAKGRLLGIQFAELFRDDLYFELARHANLQAKRLREGLTDMGVSFLTDSPSNQIFPILPKALLRAIAGEFEVCPWQEMDETSAAVRLCTSWATEPEQVEALLKRIGEAL